MKNYAIKKERFSKIISAFPKKKIMVMGDVGVDRYTIGTASRLSPEAPVPVVAVSSQQDKLAMAANVADNLKAFRSMPILSAMIGPDRVGKELIELLEKNEINASHVFEHKSRRTPLKERVIAQNQHVVRIDHESIDPLSAEAESFYLGKILQEIPKLDGIILEDYAKGLCTKKVLHEVIQKARSEKVFISVDPPTMGTRSPSDYRGVSMITPNIVEAEKLTGMEIKDENDVKRVGERLLKEVDCAMVVLTRGSLGMTIFTPSAESYTIPTFARAVYDVSGAGDTLVSMFTLAMVSGATMEEAAILSNFAAGVEVGKPGTATVSLEELEEYMERRGGYED